MAIRDKMAENAQGLLDPGEQIQAVIGAQTFSQYWSLLSYWVVIFKNSYRMVVITDRRIAVFETGKWSMTKPKQLLRSLPRDTPIPQPSGMWWKTDAFGERLYIHKRFHKDVKAAVPAA